MGQPVTNEDTRSGKDHIGGRVQMSECANASGYYW